MKTIDLKKDLKHLCQPSAREVVQVDVPSFQFLMIDGRGDPNSSREYAEAVDALFSVSYTVKFMVKNGRQHINYTVMPLEGLWWADNMSDFVDRNRTQWKWTMMISQPSFVSEEVIKTALVEVTKKKALPAIGKVRLETYAEGLCTQVLYIGPFSKEGPTIEKVHQFIAARGRPVGKHHEIYLSDIRKTAPAKWRTIIRQPMR